MKCPKCGFNSFEFYNTCKKCSNDLTAYKDTFGLKAIVLPLEARASLAESYRTETTEAGQASAVKETATDMFSFELPEGETTAPDTATANDNPFNFDEDPQETQTQIPGDFSFDKPMETQSQDFAEFSFDEPDATEPPSIGDFSFDEEQKSPQAKADEDAFADLLNSSSLDGKADVSTPTVPQESAFSTGTGEFDLDSFSWEETPEAPVEAGTIADGNPGNIFDDKVDSTKK